MNTLSLKYTTSLSLFPYEDGCKLCAAYVRTVRIFLLICLPFDWSEGEKKRKFIIFIIHQVVVARLLRSKLARKFIRIVDNSSDIFFKTSCFNHENLTLRWWELDVLTKYSAIMIPKLTSSCRVTMTHLAREEDNCSNNNTHTQWFQLKCH